MKLLWVTSFGKDMYEATGQRLVRSFLRTRSTGDLLLCAEGGAGAETRHPRVRRFELEESPVLARWLAANRDIIPVELGGEAGECDCPATDVFRGHHEGCPSVWWNKNASRWFRKVVAVDYATSLGDDHTVIWLDSDCRFRKRVDEEVVRSWFGRARLFIHKSPKRAVVESGVMGFRGEGGRRFVSLVMRRFVSGRFRRDPRWDDGYQFQRVLDLHPEITRRDLAKGISGNMHVVENSPVGEYLAHQKGVHGRSGVMW
ncbi:MAG: hypothetical protein U0Q16_03430 [Bryobacteraceae bacterium]